MMIFGRRVPLWTTLVPLVLAAGFYAHWWQGQRDAFRAELTALLDADVKTHMSGFPYRLSADLGRVALTRGGAGSSLQLSADRITLDRQPFKRGLTVIGAARPRLAVAANAIAGARLVIDAPSGRASVDTAFGRLARLSAEFTAADLALGIVPVAARADHFEFHVRETPIAPIAFPTGPTMPTQAQIVVRANGIRFDAGAPLTLEAELAVTAAAPLRSVRGWAAQGGTVELRRLSLADGQGSVADVSATAVPMPDGRLRIAGTIVTTCPRNVLAALNHLATPRPEYRARRPMRIAFGGIAGAVVPLVDEAALGQFTVRSQEPPCPVLRGPR